MSQKQKTKQKIEEKKVPSVVLEGNLKRTQQMVRWGKGGRGGFRMRGWGCRRRYRAQEDMAWEEGRLSTIMVTEEAGRPFNKEPEV